MDSFTHFFTLAQQKKLLMLDEIYWLGINPQIPSLDRPPAYITGQHTQTFDI